MLDERFNKNYSSKFTKEGESVRLIQQAYSSLFRDTSLCDF